MSNYTKTTNFASKDNLSPGNPLKIVKGTEIDTEFNNIQTAVATKTDNSAANITGGSITGITDLAVADGGTGASTATAALNNLLPSQTSNANKYLQTDGTNATWDAVSLSTADITGTLPVANGGTGVTSSTGTGNVVLSNSPTLVTPALGTPASGVATNLTGLPISTGVSGLGTGVATFLGTPSSANLASAVTDETGSGALVFANSPTLVTPALGTPASGVLTNATGLPISTGVSGLGTGVATFLATPSSANLISAVTDETGTGSLVFATSPTLVTPALGTPSALVGTNITGTASGLTAGNVTTNANLTGAITSVGNATSLGSFSSANLLGALTDETGTGSAVFATSPTLVTPILGTPTSATLTNATGLPIATGVSGLGTGIATALAVNTGSSGAPVINGGVLGTPSSGTLTNATGLPLTTGVTGTLPTANGGTNLTSFTSGGVVYASSSSALATGSAFNFNGTKVSIGTTEANRGLNVYELNNTANSTTSFWNLDYAGLFVRNTSTTTNTLAGIGFSGGSSGNSASGIANILESVNAGALGFFTGGANAGSTVPERMRIDSAGNLGLGVTPSAWNLKAIEVGALGNGLMSGGLSDFWITSNAYYNSGWKYAGTNLASSYNQAAGKHIWYNATSGTAGNNVTFTQAMTLDVSGNLLVGTTTPVYNASGRGLITINGSSAAAVGFTASGADKGIILHTGTDMIMSNSVAGAITFQTTNTERARIPAAGGFQSKTTISVGDATPSLSGAGITFPASQSASSDANTLDDYEEGTWTPVVADASSGGNTGTYTNVKSIYTKIGRQVTVNAYLSAIVTTGMTAGNNLYIRGLPFTSADYSQGNFYTYRVGRNASTVSSSVAISSGATHLQFQLYTTNSATTDLYVLVSNVVSSTSEIMISISYTV